MTNDLMERANSIWKNQQMSTQAVASALLDLITKHVSEHDTALEEILDQSGSECGNCGCRIIARGGSLGEHGGLSSTENGDLPLCGYCMGLEAADMARQLAEPPQSAQRIATLERALAESEAKVAEDTARLDWLWDNGWIDISDDDGKLTPRVAIDAARKEPK